MGLLEDSDLFSKARPTVDFVSVSVQLGIAKLAWNHMSGYLRAGLLVGEGCDGDLFDAHGDDWRGTGLMC